MITHCNLNHQKQLKTGKNIKQMNKEYIKTLQQRAQRLLEISSDEGSDNQKPNLSQIKNQHFHSNQALETSQIDQMKIDFQDYRNTDIQLLKKCINMTNQNTQLKRQLKSAQLQNSQLIKKLNHLESQLQYVKSQPLQNNQNDQLKHNRPESPFNKLKENDHFSFIDRNTFEGLKQKSQSIYKFSVSKEIKNDQSTNSKQIEKIEQRYSKQISQLEQRLKVANQKKENFEKLLGKQKEKLRKLWQFISQQIPELKEIITNLTNKVDAHVESLLLKDINQNQMQSNFTKMSKHHNRRDF